MGLGILCDRFSHDMSNRDLRGERAVVYFGPACFENPGKDWRLISWVTLCANLYSWRIDCFDKKLLFFFLHDSSPFKHGPACGLLDHEENPPALEGPCYSTIGHLLPPLPDRVDGRGGTCGYGNFIGSLCKPGPIFNTVQHIVWGHNPLSWLGEQQQQ